MSNRNPKGSGPTPAAQAAIDAAVRYRPKLVEAVRAMGPAYASLADDSVQEAIVDVLCGNAPGLDASNSNSLSYLKGIAKKKALSLSAKERKRRRRRDQYVHEQRAQELSPAADASPIAAELELLLQELLSGLTAFKQALGRSAILGEGPKSAAAIGRIFGVSESTALRHREEVVRHVGSEFMSRTGVELPEPVRAPRAPSKKTRRKSKDQPRSCVDGAAGSFESGDTARFW